MERLSMKKIKEILQLKFITDMSIGIIKKVIATTASTHDSTQFEKLTAGEEKAIFADSGYMPQERKKSLRKKVSLMVS